MILGPRRPALRAVPGHGGGHLRGAEGWGARWEIDPGTANPGFQRYKVFYGRVKFEIVLAGRPTRSVRLVQGVTRLARRGRFFAPPAPRGRRNVARGSW